MIATALRLWELQRGGKVLERCHTCAWNVQLQLKRQLRMKRFSPVRLTLSYVFSSGFCELLLGFLSIRPHSDAVIHPGDVFSANTSALKPYQHLMPAIKGCTQYALLLKPNQFLFFFFPLASRRDFHIFVSFDQESEVREVPRLIASIFSLIVEVVLSNE